MTMPPSRRKLSPVGEARFHVTGDLVRIEKVQYDGEGEWLDVRFDDGRGFRFTADVLRVFAEQATENRETALPDDVKELP